MARWLVRQELAPDRVVSSAAVRARSTAEHVADTFGLVSPAVEFDEDLYSAGFRQWLGRVRAETVDRLLICGHNPSLDLLVELLSATTPTRSSNGKLMTTAAIAQLRFDTPWSEILPGAGELVTIARPREL